MTQTSESEAQFYQGSEAPMAPELEPGTAFSAEPFHDESGEVVGWFGVVIELPTPEQVEAEAGPHDFD